MIPPDAVKNAASGDFFICATASAKAWRRVGKKSIQKKKVFSIKNGKKLCKHGEYGILCKYTCG